MESKLKVVLRIRPYLKKEQNSSLNSDGEPLVKEGERVLSVRVPQKESLDGGKRLDQKYMETEFDKIYDTDATQEAIFNDEVEPLIKAFFEGVNCTVLAYGQTGSGKSYTMGTFPDHAQLSMDLEQAGILPRALVHIFNAIKKFQSESLSAEVGQRRAFTLKVSFIELYNEEFNDLLKPGTANPAICNFGATEPYASSPERRERATATIQIREDPSGALYTTGAEETVCHSATEALDCLIRGAQVRATGSTAMNETSSRSHAIYTVTLQQNITVAKDLDEEKQVESEYSLLSKFHFVDLAGSERLKRTLSTGSRASEGISINQGLHVLGKVIAALAEKCGGAALRIGSDTVSSSPKRVHVPYRDSKLTRLLQDSIGGNSNTMMLACVAPSEADLPETISTLQYASKARKIRNTCKVNIKSKDCSAANKRLLKQVEELKQQLERAVKGSYSDREALLLRQVQAIAQSHYERTLRVLLEGRNDQQRLNLLSDNAKRVISPTLHFELQKS